MEDLKDLFANLDSLLSQTNIEDVTEENTGYSELPEGYYLCEVVKAELKESKSSHQPMAAFQFKIIENGQTIKNEDEPEFIELKNTKNRMIFMYYVLKDEGSVKRFVSDMLKFEGEEEGQPLLGKEYFTNSELLEDALDVLTGMQIYVCISSSENQNGETSIWKNLISWKRADKLGLAV